MAVRRRARQGDHGEDAADPNRLHAGRARPVHPRLPVDASDRGVGTMGTDPSSSVTNTYGQGWDTPNVIVTGAALFPQNAGARIRPARSGRSRTGWPRRCASGTSTTPASFSDRRDAARGASGTSHPKGHASSHEHACGDEGDVLEHAAAPRPCARPVRRVRANRLTRPPGAIALPAEPPPHHRLPDRPRTRTRWCTPTRTRVGATWRRPARPRARSSR